MANTLVPLLSTVAPDKSADELAQLTALVEAAVADAKVLDSEVSPGIQALLAQLAADEVVQNAEDGKTLTLLEEASPEFQAFIAQLKQTIFDAKAATPQGLLLAQQLKAGSIDQKQFKIDVNKISLSPVKLQAATAKILPGLTQKLLLALSSSPKLLQLAKLVSKANTKSSATPDALPTTAEAKPQENTKIATDFKDEKLSFLQNVFAVAAAIAKQNLAASKSSLISLKPAPRIMNGARAVLKINNKVVALCNNVSYEINMDWSEIRGVDELIPNDLAPMVFSVKGSMSIYRVPDKSPISDFIHQDMFRGMIWPYTTIEIRDKRTDELIMLVKRAAITSRAESFTKNQLTSTAMSFIGIGFRDEAIPELLPDKLTGEDDGGGGLLDAFKAITNLI